MSGGGRLAAVALGVVGAGLVLGAAGRVWATVTVDVKLPGLTGRELGGAISALGLAGLAGTAALLVTRGWARALIGALVAAFGVIIAIMTPAALAHGHVAAVAGGRSSLVRTTGAVAVHVSGAWPAASAAGGVLLAAAGILAAVWGRRWPGLSARYDRPGAAASTGEDPASLWKAIDRGEDPTTGEEADPKRARQLPEAPDRPERDTRARF